MIGLVEVGRWAVGVHTSPRVRRAGPRWRAVWNGQSGIVCGSGGWEGGAREEEFWGDELRYF